MKDTESVKPVTVKVGKELRAVRSVKEEEGLQEWCNLVLECIHSPHKLVLIAKARVKRLKKDVPFAKLKRLFPRKRPLKYQFQ